jgi:hypothetical protein
MPPTGRRADARAAETTVIASGGDRRAWRDKAGPTRSLSSECIQRRRRLHRLPPLSGIRAMAQVDADRNLLFGILALQMDFISRDALVAAMNAWVLDKTKPLGRILIDQGALSSIRHDLLDALVREHLKQHGGDPQKSLTAVSSIGSARRDLAKIADPEIKASLPLVSSGRAEDDPYATRLGSSEDPFLPRPGSAGTPSSSGMRFTILRPHAKGGLGQVSVARDEELNLAVALKEIQDRHADDPNSRSRFLARPRSPEATLKTMESKLGPDQSGIAGEGPGRPRCGRAGRARRGRNRTRGVVQAVDSWRASTLR